MAGNKCATCGQWAGKGHTCPTPTVAIQPSHTVPVLAGARVGANTAVAQRVDRAREYLTTMRPAPVGIVDNPDHATQPVQQAPWSIHHPTHDPRSRQVDYPGSANVRTLGGIPTTDGGQIAAGRVLRGEAPYLMGKEGVDALVASGVRHFVDLRGEHEVEVEGNGALQPYIDSGEVKVYRVRMTLDPKFLADNPGFDPYDDLGGTYVRIIEGTGPDMTQPVMDAFRAADADGSQVYIHCAVGKDRTGLVSAALLDLAGADRRAIEDDYVATASTFAPVAEKLRKTDTYKKDFVDTPPSRYTPNRRTIDSFLGHIDRSGGARTLLTRYGMSDQDATDLARMLRTPH